MEVIEKKIKCLRADVFSLHPIGDIHGGSMHCAEAAIERRVADIKADRNAFWVGMGDYMECILPNDKRFDIGGLAPWVVKDDIVESQREWVVNLLKPIAGKCLGLITGNHEETIHMNGEGDVTRHLCKDLGVPYLSASAFINLKFERSGRMHHYRVHAWHGAGAAQSHGGRLMRLMSLVNDVEADIYLMGHLHTIMQHTPERLVCRQGRVRSIQLAAAITGSWMTTYTQPKAGEHLNSGYGERRGYKPSRIGAPVIHIHADKGIFTIES